MHAVIGNIARPYIKQWSYFQAIGAHVHMVCSAIHPLWQDFVFVSFQVLL